MDDIHEIGYMTQGSVKEKNRVFELMHDADIKVATNAAWAMTHFDRGQDKWLYSKREELMELAMTTADATLRRLSLTLLERLELGKADVRTDFLDFCIGHTMMVAEPYGVRTLCMKLAFNLSRHYPELLSELRHCLDIMEPDLLPPSIKCARKNILQKMKSTD